MGLGTERNQGFTHPLGGPHPPLPRPEYGVRSFLLGGHSGASSSYSGSPWVSSGESGKLLGYLGAPGDGGAERVERAERSQLGGFVQRWSRSVQGPIWTSPGRTPLRAKPLPDVKWGDGGQ